VKVGKVTWPQIEAIAKDKMSDLNCFTEESAMKMVSAMERATQFEAQYTSKRELETEPEIPFGEVDGSEPF
jgi:hypothetical protein